MGGRSGLGAIRLAGRYIAQTGLNPWLACERDVGADDRQVFGEEPGRLIGVAVMTDSDNTQSQARAWYGPVGLDGALLARQPY